MGYQNSPLAILAVLAEMARCLNQNLAKVKLTPLDPALSGGLSPAQSAPTAPVTKLLRG